MIKSLLCILKVEIQEMKNKRASTKNVGGQEGLLAGISSFLNC